MEKLIRTRMEYQRQVYFTKGISRIESTHGSRYRNWERRYFPYVVFILLHSAVFVDRPTQRASVAQGLFYGGSGRRAVAHTCPAFSKNAYGPVGIPFMILLHSALCVVCVIVFNIAGRIHR